MNKEKNLSWKTDFGSIRELVNEWDPFNLIKIGSPKEEYDNLSFKILSGLRNGKSDDELKKDLIALLEDDFGFQHQSADYSNRIRFEKEIEQLIEKGKKRPASNI